MEMTTPYQDQIWNSVANSLLQKTNIRELGKSLLLIAGAMIIPCFHRGDYHSIAETAAGVQHIIAHYYFGELAALSPKEALAKAFDWMILAAAPEHRMAMRLSADKILEQTKFIKYDQR